MVIIPRKLFCLLAVLLICSFSAPAVYASDLTVFGPKDFEIKRWHFHFSLHRFKVDEPGEGVISITKNTPDKKTRRGFLLLNRNLIPLRNFFRSNDLVLEKELRFRSHNRLFVFLNGTRGASIRVEVKKKGLPPVNNEPVADDESVITDEDAQVSITLTGADPDGDHLSYHVVTGPTHGTLNGTAPNLTYTPNAHFNGTDSFTFKVNDGIADSNIATVTLTISPVNDTPMAEPQTVTTDEDTPIAITLRGSDVDGDALTYAVVSGPNNGTLALNGDGSFTYTPNPDFNGQDTFAYTVDDGKGGMDTGTVSITVIPVADTPEDVDYGQDDDEQEGGGGLVGETIRILNGNNVEFRSDLAFASPNSLGLSFEGFYNSRSKTLGDLGYGWTHTYDVLLDPAFVYEGMAYVKIIDQTGRAHYFLEEDPGFYKGAFKERTHVKAEARSYVWYRLDGTRYGLSASGELIWIEDEKGNRLELSYDIRGRLETVTDVASGRTLTFHYYVDGVLEQIEGSRTAAVPDQIWVSFGYDDNQNLISVTYADGSGFDYTYANRNLTEKKNKAGHIINTWRYDGQDRAVTNFSVQDRRVSSIAYVSETQVEVTDAYGVKRIYSLEDIDGRKRVTAMQGLANAPYSDSDVVRWVYDANMMLIETDSAGDAITQYQSYDERGNPGKVILAKGTVEERVITYTYHQDVNVPLSRTEASVLSSSGDKVTIWDYDNDLNDTPNENPTKLLSRIIEKGFTKDGLGAVIPFRFITAFTYNSKGQVLSIDGPLPGNGDTTSFTYDNTTGDLGSITRPLIGSTIFTGYDAAGQLGMLTDVNGQLREFSYDAKGRITAITNNVDGSSTTIKYNMAGLPDSVTDEDWIKRIFQYDTEHGRLISIKDTQGNYIAYDYDTQGNRIEMSKYDPSETRFSWKRWDYQHHDMPGKLRSEINADGTFTEYGYDSEGNVASVKDPNGNITYYEYDTLNRLIMVAQPGDVITEYAYDRHGNLSSVTDAEGRETTFEYDDIGRVVSTTSSDTGAVTYVYDEVGNPIKKKDAKGVTVDYTYDFLNRLTSVEFPDPSQDIIYIYDGGIYGKGRLTRITDPSGSTTFNYDIRGRLIEKTGRVNGNDYRVSCAYTPSSRLASIAYPAGRNVVYTRNSTGKITSASTTYDGNTTTLLENISYLPFGPAASLDMGTGSGVTNVYDELYRMRIANPGAQTERTYEYDANGNITSIQETNTPWNDQNFMYDGLDRLTEAGGPYGTISYTYDKVGNRKAKDINGQAGTYSYIHSTNRLESITGSGPVTFTYDANGNTTGIGDKELVYNHNNRLIEVKEDGITLASYTYNGLGQRVTKEVDGVTTIFHYDLHGKLIAESLSDGTMLAEYLYMGKIRVAKVDISDDAISICYYLNNKLGTPQLMTDENGVVAWEAKYKPFGEAEVHPKSSVVNNLRFPGQYFDRETRLYYNYLRDYHPGIGRYIQPDPIGMEGGINLYAYVLNNPVNFTDPTGQVGVPGIVIGAASGAFAGFAAGMKSGHVWAGIAGGAVGGLTGGLIGFIFPPAGSTVGGMIGGAIAGALGGAFGGGVGKVLGDPDASNKEKLLAMGKGAGIGVLVGGTAGGLGTAALSAGATPLAAELAGVMASAPIATGLGMIEFYGGPDPEGEIGPTIPENYDYAPDWFPEFGYDANNPETIDRNSSVIISVVGETPPYTWSVSGNGFSLAQSQTSGLSNTLHADDTACGSAIINVTDRFGAEVSGSLRELNYGQWVIKGNYCGLSGSVSWYDLTGSGYHEFHFEIISGNKKQYQKSKTNFLAHEDCSNVPAICSDWNVLRCPEDYRDANCIDGDYANYYPYVCESGSYHCFCVDELAYYEWECD